MDEKAISLETTSFTAARLNGRIPLIALLLGLLVVAGFIITRTIQKSAAVQAPDQVISAQTLADQYGVQVNLIAVTAAGGLVDLRLKILDGEKAKLLFQDSGDVPSLRVGEGGTVLNAPEDSESQLFNSLEDDGNVFLMFPNVGHVTKPGTPVTVVFGDVGLEPIMAQ